MCDSWAVGVLPLPPGRGRARADQPGHTELVCLSGRGSTILVTTITAILIAGCTTNRSTDAASSRDSSSSRSSSGSPAVRCTEASVRKLVNQFVVAFNLGDQRALQQLWAPQGKGFDWYATDAPGQRIRSDAMDRAGLERYFARRHFARESLRLTSFQFSGNAAAYGNFQYTLIRQADGLAPTAYTGKGAALCGPTRAMLGVWSMARTPRSWAPSSTSWRS